MRALAATFAVTVALAAPRARADGALPDSLSISTPAARPHDITLATNFGLVLSHDDGRRWVWSCEQAGNAYGIPVPGRTGAAESDLLHLDGPARRAPARLHRRRFVHLGRRRDPRRPLPRWSDRLPRSHRREPGARGRGGADETAAPSMRCARRTTAVPPCPRCSDRAAGGDFITGLEIARAAARHRLCLTMGSGVTRRCRCWYAAPTAATTGILLSWARAAGRRTSPCGCSLLIHVQDPSRVFLRAERRRQTTAWGWRRSMPRTSSPSRPSLALNGGVITAFAQLAERAPVRRRRHRPCGGGVPLRRRRVSLPAVAWLPSLKGASARGEHPCTPSPTRPWPASRSPPPYDPEGQSWQPLMRYDRDRRRSQSCAAALCQEDCAARATRGQWPAALCAAPDPTTAPAGGGCGCTAAADTPGSDLLAFVALLLTRRLLAPGGSGASIRPCPRGCSSSARRPRSRPRWRALRRSRRPPPPRGTQPREAAPPREELPAERTTSRRPTSTTSTAPAVVRRRPRPARGRRRGADCARPPRRSARSERSSPTPRHLRTNLPAWSRCSSRSPTPRSPARGRIGVITSVAGERAARNYTYGAAKGALTSTCRGCASAPSPAGVKVTTLKLGPVDTPMTESHKKTPSSPRRPGSPATSGRAIDAGRGEVFVPRSGAASCRSTETRPSGSSRRCLS